MCHSTKNNVQLTCNTELHSPFMPSSSSFLAIQLPKERSEVHEQCLCSENDSGQRQNNSLPSLPTSNAHVRPSYVLSANIQWKGLKPSFIPSCRFCVDSTGRHIQLGVFTWPRTPPRCCDTAKVQAQESNSRATLKISGYYSSSTLIVLRLN